MGEKFLYIDDSGQLSNNGTHEYFLYGCLFIENVTVLNELKNKVNAFCKTRHIKEEIKGSKIKGKYRKKLLEILNSVNGAQYYFVIDKNDLLDRLDFNNPFHVKRHKQYLIRRVIETIFYKHRFLKEDKIHIKIDNESFNSEAGIENFKKYLNDFWSKPGSFMFHENNWQYMPLIESSFTIEYLDSKVDRMIQMADLVANTKYRRFKGNPKCGSEYLEDHICLKLPDNKNYYSPKSKNKVETL